MSDAIARVVDEAVVRSGRKFEFAVLRVARGDTVTEHDVVRHPGAVVIVPILPDRSVVLIRNHRVAVGSFVLEAPAGTLEPPEPPLGCAARELREETGYTAGRLIDLGWFYTTPGMTDEKMHAFAALDLTEGDAALEADEHIEVEVTAGPMALVADNAIRDAKTIAALTLCAARGLIDPAPAGGR